MGTRLSVSQGVSQECDDGVSSENACGTGQHGRHDRQRFYETPTDLGADEKHSRMSGEKVYIATTVGNDCFLGASVSHGAGEEEFAEAYRQFEHEAHQVQPDYQPETVNCNGWQATMKAWRTLFPSICLIQCFLHAILSIKNVSTCGEGQISLCQAVFFMARWSRQNMASVPIAS